MARLLNDANKLDSTILGKGVTVDDKFENVTFDQMIRAIHVIQEELKITGTTADEAGRTISGSLGSMRAAWKNFLTGTGSPEQFVEALTGSANNITRQLKIIIPKLVTGLKALATAIAPEVPKIIMDVLPAIIEGAATLLQSGASMLPELIQTLVPPLIQGAVMVMSALVENLPDILKSFADALPVVLTTLMENSGNLLDAGRKILSMLANGLLDASAWVGQNFTGIINKIGDFLTNTDAVRKTVEIAGQIIVNLIGGLFSSESINNLVEAAPKLLSAIGDGIGAATEAMAELCKSIIKGIVDYLFGDDAADHWKDLISLAGSILDFIANGIFDAIALGTGLIFDVAGAIAEIIGVGDYWQIGYDMIADWAEGVKQSWKDRLQWLTDLKDAIAGILVPTQRSNNAWNQLGGDVERNPVVEAQDMAQKYGYGVQTTYDPTKAIQQSVLPAGMDKYSKTPSEKAEDYNWLTGYENVANRKVGYGTKGYLNVPIFGNGGIVTKPTLALIGEDGAEAVVPLEKESNIGRSFGGGMTIQKIEVNVDAHGIEDINNLGNIIVEQIDSALRRYQVQQSRGIGGTAW